MMSGVHHENQSFDKPKLSLKVIVCVHSAMTEKKNKAQNDRKVVKRLAFAGRHA